MNPQLFGPVSDRLFAAGALDVFLTAVQMKKGRPGTLVTVLAPDGLREALCDVLFRETTTIGVRFERMWRETLERRWVDVAVDGRLGADQGRRPPRRGAQRRAGVRRLPARRRRDRPAGQGRSGRSDAAPGSTGASDVVAAVRTIDHAARSRSPDAHGRASTSPPPSTTSTAGRTSGTAYEKIAADVIARYKRLAGFDVRFVMGNDEHSQNVFRKARGAGPRRRWPTATGWRTSSATVWSRLDISFDDFIRTTEPRHRRAVAGRSSSARTSAGDIYRGRLRGLVLRLVRGLQAGEGPGRRAVSDPQDEAGLDQGEELLLPAVGLPRPRCSRTTPRIRRSSSPSRGATRCCGCSKAGLEDISVSRAGQAWGIPLPFDPTSVVYVWYDALINYAAAVGLRQRQSGVRHLVAGRPAHRRQGHHAVPLRRLAGDADERGPRAAAAGLRPRLGAVQGREDEQVARHRASIRSRRPIGSAPIRCAGI